MALEKKDISRKLLNPFKGDKAIWFIFVVLAIISLVSVFSSIGYTAIITHTTPEKALVRHFLFIVVTFVIVILLSNFDYRKFSGFSLIGFLLAIALLSIVLFKGHSDNVAGSGMSRWIYIPLIGRFQPSEFAKVIIIIYLARLLAQEKNNIHEWTTFRKVLLPVVIIAVLIVSDNLSTAVIIYVISFIMIRLSPAQPKHLWLSTIAMLLFGLALITIGDKMNIPFLERSNTWASRIDKWLNFNEEEVSQESMAKMAVATGKMTGVGIGSTIQARLMTQANNDLIYAIILEETGMVGGIIVFLLYVFLYIRCIRIAWRCNGYFGRMTVVGLGTMIFVQAAIHMCVSVGALPITGQTLPLISSGGSSYLCMGLAIGVIQSVAYDVNKTNPEQGRKRKKPTENAESQNAKTEAKESENNTQ